MSPHCTCSGPVCKPQRMPATCRVPMQGHVGLWHACRLSAAPASCLRASARPFSCSAKLCRLPTSRSLLFARRRLISLRARTLCSSSCPARFGSATSLPEKKPPYSFSFFILPTQRF